MSRGRGNHRFYFLLLLALLYAVKISLSISHIVQMKLQAKQLEKINHGEAR